MRLCHGRTQGRCLQSDFQRWFFAHSPQNVYFDLHYAREFKVVNLLYSLLRAQESSIFFLEKCTSRGVEFLAHEARLKVWNCCVLWLAKKELASANPTWD